MDHIMEIVKYLEKSGSLIKKTLPKQLKLMQKYKKADFLVCY